MRHLLTLLYLLAFTQLSTAGKWLPREIGYVRAYVYDYSQEKDNKSLLKHGRLHKGIINTGGYALSQKQTQRLLKALSYRKKELSAMLCYMPHHGFVFFDKAGKPMGHLELCFQCGNKDYSPQGLPDKPWDWDEMQNILQELNIPILRKDEDYTRLYLEKKAQQQTQQQKANTTH